jgi:hypothetical protein
MAERGGDRHPAPVVANIGQFDGMLIGRRGVDKNLNFLCFSSRTRMMPKFFSY